MESKAPTTDRATRLCASTAIVAVLCALVVGCHTRVAGGHAASSKETATPTASDPAFNAASPAVAEPARADFPTLDPRAQLSTTTPMESVGAADK